MTGYLVNFGIYTMAMLGLIFFALMVYKKFAVEGNFSKVSKNHNLSIEETMTIGPRKTLYVVKAGSERFLIAGDVDKTTLISKLDGNSSHIDITSVTSEKPVAAEEPIIETVGKIVDFVKNNTTVENKTTKIKENTANKITKTEIHKTSSVDDLPVIVDFQDKVNKQSGVLKDMLKKMNG